MELIRLPKSKSEFYHSPTPRGMCTVMNTPPYMQMKQFVGSDGHLKEHFRIKEEVGFQKYSVICSSFKLCMTRNNTLT